MYKIRLLSFVVVLLFTFLLNVNCYAQLKKTNSGLRKIGTIEKVKSFQMGVVVLGKAYDSSTELFFLNLANLSSYHEAIVLELGTKEEMIVNLNDLSKALEEGKKGEVFEFSANGENYTFSYNKFLGQRCFDVRKPYSVKSDRARLFKTTIDDIIDFINKNMINKTIDSGDIKNNEEISPGVDDYNAEDYIGG